MFMHTVEFDDRGQSLTPNVSYPYEVNWQLVTENGSLTPTRQLCSAGYIWTVFVQ